MSDCESDEIMDANFLESEKLKRKEANKKKKIKYLQKKKISSHIPVSVPISNDVSKPIYDDYISGTTCDHNKSPQLLQKIVNMETESDLNASDAYSTSSTFI